MASRKDLLKAHTFITERLVAALVDRDPDNPEPPLKRLVTASWVGVMIGVLVLAGFGVVGLLRPGSSKNWQTDRTVIIDASSGGVLVFLGGKLFPVHNIASAKLATAGGEVKTVKASSLRDFPRQPAIGIREAPKQLPDAKDMTAFPIRTCSVAAPVGARSSARFTTLEIGTGEVPGGSASFVARSDDGEREYLVADGRAYEMPTHAIALHLGFGEQAVAPGDAWLRALPQGPALKPIDIPGRGSRSRQPVAGIDPTIGTVMHVDGAVRTSYVLLSEGLSEISPLEAAVLEVAYGKKSVPVKPKDANDARNPLLRTVAHPAMPFTLPTRTQIADPARASVCATWAAAGQTPRIAFDAPTPPVGARATNPENADTVVMPSLRGALLKVEGSVGADDPGVLVVDGLKYGLADKDAKAALGYGQITPTAVSPAVLRLVPAGMAGGGTLSVKAAGEAS